MTTRVSSYFGPRELFGRSYHQGIDYASPIGSPIYNNKELRVVYAGEQKGFGNVVRAVDNQGTEYIFGHLDSIPAGTKSGATLPSGSLIAHTGNSGDSTGAHLHYEIRQGRPPKSVDPLTTIDPTTGKPYENNASFERGGPSLRNSTAKKDPNYTALGKDTGPVPALDASGRRNTQAADQRRNGTGAATELKGQQPVLPVSSPRTTELRINPLLKLGNK